jgi:hypothetical protein
MRDTALVDRITIRNYDVTGEDARHNQVRTLTRTLVDVPALVQPSTTLEDPRARDLTAERFDVYLKPTHRGAAVIMDAHTEIIWQGRTLKVEGDGQAFSALNRTNVDHLEVNVVDIHG